MSQQDESRLIARCRQGDEQAWDSLFELHYAPTARFVFQLASDLTREDVEEICQDAFLSVIKNLGSFHGDCRFETWVFRIAANKAADFRERRNAAKRGSGRPTVSLQAENSETGLTLDPPSSLPPPDLLLINSEQADLVHLALESLDPSCREILQLRYFGDLSYEEISAALQLNPKTVSSRLSKCLDRLENLVRRTFAGENSPLSPSNT